MTRLFSRLLVTTALGLVAVSAQASRDFYIDGSIRTPSNQFYSYKQPLSGGVFQPIVAAQQSVMTQLRTSLQTPLLAAVQKVDGYQSGYVSVDGPVHINYNLGDVAVSGLRVQIGATVKKSSFGITATCNVVLIMDGSTTFAGHVDFSTGVVNNLQVQNFTLRPSYDCSTSLDWVPVVGQIASLAVDNLADQIVSDALKQAYNKLDDINHQLAPVSFMGLNTLVGNLPPELVPSLSYIQNRIASGFQNIQNLYVMIGDPKRRVFGPTGYAHQAASHDSILSISVDGYNFEVLEHRYYYDEMYCPPSTSGRACFPF